MPITNPILEDSEEDLNFTAGKEYRMDVSGDFGGGTVTLNYVDSAGNYKVVAGTTFTVEGTIVFVANQKTLRMILTGATAPAVSYNFTRLT